MFFNYDHRKSISCLSSSSVNDFPCSSKLRFKSVKYFNCFIAPSLRRYGTSQHKNHSVCLLNYINVSCAVNTVWVDWNGASFKPNVAEVHFRVDFLFKFVPIHKKLY